MAKILHIWPLLLVALAIAAAMFIVDRGWKGTPMPTMPQRFSATILQLALVGIAVGGYYSIDPLFAAAKPSLAPLIGRGNLQIAVVIFVVCVGLLLASLAGRLYERSEPGGGNS
jgi:peptidoglycan/LPS O-acetylase OafA/YrhL